MLEYLRNTKLTSFPPASRIQLCPGGGGGGGGGARGGATRSSLSFYPPAHCPTPTISQAVGCVNRISQIPCHAAPPHFMDGLVATHFTCAFLHSCLCCIHRLGPAPTHLHAAALSCASTLALTCCVAVPLLASCVLLLPFPPFRPWTVRIVWARPAP
jgi:hypothetical protein